MTIHGFDNIQLVVLDKDGTLTDAHVFWAEVIRRRAAALVRYFDLPQSEAAQLCQIMGLNVATGKLLPEGPIAIVSRDRVIEIVIEFLLYKYRVVADKQIIAQLFDEVHAEFAPTMTDYIRLLPGVREFLESIRGRVKIALITSDGRASTMLALTHCGIADYFDIIITRDDCPHPKVTGTPLKQLLNDTKVSPSQTLVVGDAKMDFDMAAAAGVENVLLVETGQTAAAELRQCTIYDAQCTIVERL